MPVLWARGAARMIRLRVSVRGDPPDEAELWVSNHLSYLDAVTYLTLRPLLLLAKSEVGGWPGIGACSRLIGTHFVDRHRKRDLLRVIPAMEASLRAGDSVLFFPEGTSSAGGQVLPFLSSLFEVAVRSERPVRCTRIHYRSAQSGAPAWASVCWWGDMTFADHVFRMLCLPEIEARVEIEELPLAGEDRKALARAAEAKVRSGFRPLEGAPPGAY